MDSVRRALALEEAVGQAEREGKALLAHVLRGIHVLKIFEARISAVDHAAEEAVEVAALYRFDLLADPLVLGYEMERAEDRAVAALLAERHDVFNDVVEREAAKHLAAERRRNRLHLARNGRVIFVEIGVVAARVDDAERISAGRKIEVKRLDDGI